MGYISLGVNTISPFHGEGPGGTKAACIGGGQQLGDASAHLPETAKGSQMGGGPSLIACWAHASSCFPVICQAAVSCEQPAKRSVLTPGLNWSGSRKGLVDFPLYPRASTKFLAEVPFPAASRIWLLPSPRTGALHPAEGQQ